MRVRFAADALGAPDAWPFLDMIVFDHFTKERHLWDLPNPGTVMKSRWITENSGSHWTRRNRENLEKFATKEIYRPEKSLAHTLLLKVSLSESPPGTLAPEDAKRALDLPVHVVLENAESDGSFLVAAIRAFSRTVLRSAKGKGWWTVVSAGGSGEIEKRVAELSTLVNKGRPRIVVLRDSDRIAPRPQAEVRHFGEDVGQIHDVHVVVLRKREIENYLPIEALERIPAEKRRVLQAFRRLGRAQRDHFDMKEGFKQQGGNAAIDPQQEDLFREVTEADRRDLCGGFGDRVWTLFETCGDVITKATLCATCPDDPDEIERILDTIERLL